ncbi:MAG: hypothetical protein V2B20_04305 [Pseudomonadota bacterium]
MLLHLRRHAIGDAAESGFVLVLSLVILLMLSLFGIWALQTTRSELNVAGGGQRIEKQFNIAEGAANAEAGKVGFSTKDFYKITFDPTTVHNQTMIPAAGDFDPGADKSAAVGSLSLADPTTWPWENLLRDYTANTNVFDYRYLVTYLYSDVAPMGYDPSAFSAYKFRIQGNTARTSAIVEMGGKKVGVKSSL